MSKAISLSDEAYRQIEELLRLVFRTTGDRQPDGTWIVLVDDHVWEDLQRERLPGENDEDTLVRLIEDTAVQLKHKKTIRVSDATYRAIAEEAILPFRSTATQQADGSWLVPIADDTWDALQKERLPDESDDDTVLRIIRRHRGQKPN
jgi:predicted CopG family antitoxin